MEKISSVQRVLINAKNKDKIPVLSVVRADPESSAVITKLHDDKRRVKKYDADGNLQIDIPSIGSLREAVGVIVSRKEEARNLMRMLPDLELIKQILVSCICSPKDLINTELVYELDDDIFKPKLKSLIKEKVEKYFDTTYKIKPLLTEILEDVLFYTGSYPLVVIPENALDELINGQSNFSFESLKTEFLPDGNMRPLGLLGSPTATYGFTQKPSTSFESLLKYKQQIHKRDYEARVLLTTNNSNIDSFVRVTDNYNLLKRSKIEEKVSQRLQADILQDKFSHESLNDLEDLASNRLSFSNEAMVENGSFSLTDKETVDLIYKSRNESRDNIRVIKTQDQIKRRSVSEPLIQHWPSESIIPVYVPGNENIHVGYFLLLDENGNPVTEKSLNNISDIFTANQNKPFSRNLTDYVSKQLNGSSFNCNNALHMKQMVEVYQDIVEADLLARLRNGIYSNSTKLASNQEIYRIMLARSLSGNMTQVLWVPKELMTYIALDYDDDGVGVSMLHRSSIIGALRSSLLFADVRLGIKNAVGQTVVNLKLDEDDPDPFKRINQGIGAFMQTRQGTVPWNVMSPASTAEYITKAGYIFKFEGHPGVPDMSIDTSEVNSNYNKPDIDLQEKLSKQHSMSFGIPHEIVDKFSEPELATTVVNNSILLTKRVIQHQEKLNPQITDHARKILKHSESFISEVKSLIEVNFNDIILTDSLKQMATEQTDIKQRVIDITLRDTINSLIIELPKPETTTINNQLEDLMKFEEMLDKKLDSYVSDDIIDQEVFGELAGNAQKIRAIIKAYYMRLEMDKMGMGGELNKLFSATDEDSESVAQEIVYEEASDIVKSLLISFTKFVKANEQFKTVSDETNSELGTTDSGGEDSGGDESEGDSEEGDFGAFDDSGDGSDESDQSGDTTETEPEESTEETSETSETSELGADEPLSF